ncbi:helicase [Leekyejoonella antrihumi]|uniref:Helicase n=2 Tax=Leekyejoonella antrihumi TaxID=1660198 RepID=A0A563E9C0_9MICO|nr:helicase [Leekyejoonella antrihumi]
MVEAEGLSRGRTDRTGVARDEEVTGLFERDALVFNASRRRRVLETQWEGLVFGRLDMASEQDRGVDEDGEGEVGEVRYVGRIGVRDDDYEPLVVDWRAPAASPFYRATPVSPEGVVRRRVLRSRDARVIGVEDDLMVPEAPDGMVVVGDGALMAALTRTRGTRMRDIVATIQRHQDEAIRAGARGITEITGGPGTGKTVVALHRAAYLLYSDRRRFESGGILVVGPSASYTAYIERVLPSLGEESVILRSLGDVVDGMTSERLDDPEAARVKGSLSIRPVLARAARDVAPEVTQQLRVMVAGHPVRLDAAQLTQIRRQVLRNHQHNSAFEAARAAVGEAAWAQVRSGEKSEFLETLDEHLAVRDFLRDWWRPIDPREVLIWLADADRCAGYCRSLLPEQDAAVLHASMQCALQQGSWSVADVALVDDLTGRLGVVQDEEPAERGFYEIEEMDSLSEYGVNEVQVTGSRAQAHEPLYERVTGDPLDLLMQGRIDRGRDYAHVLVDEAQDLSPMQWRMIGRRGRSASWTVVGDAAQSSWTDATQAIKAREEAFGAKARQRFHMDTNYRNAREIFDYAAQIVRREVPDADIPNAVRETGVEPIVREVAGPGLADAVVDATKRILDEVEGAVAVVVPAAHHHVVRQVTDLDPGRALVIDPMSTKGLEYDGTVIVDPAEIIRESPGGIRVLYVALTRAAHRMTVVEVQKS